MKLKLIFFWILILVMSALGMEVVLRCLGYEPGDLRPNWLYFREVDSLYVVPQFFTNEYGILVADSMYWSQQNVVINKEGFRGNDFTKVDSSKKKVMVIGDSFTWGLSATPFQDSSFCDLLQRNTNYEIINCGIPAADPLQYSLIAERYVHQIKPDIVFVIFFTGNDLMRYDRIISKGEESYYWTNAGAIFAEIDGRHFHSAKEAYEYLRTRKYFLRNPKSFLEKSIANSSFLSRFYAGKFRIQEKVEAEKARRFPDISLRYLYKIKEVTDAEKIPLRIILVPEKKEVDKNLRKHYCALVTDAYLTESWKIPEYLDSYYMDYPDGHWNNKGHKYMALYLKSIIYSEVSR